MESASSTCIVRRNDYELDFKKCEILPFLAINIHSTTKIVSNGYDGLQGVIPTLQEKIISPSSSEIEREKLKCLVENIRWEPTLSAMGYFEVNRGTLVSMISIREFICNNQK